MIQSHAAFLSPVPHPPHDPRRIRLDHRAGWRPAALDGAEIARPLPTRCRASDPVLRLAYHPDVTPTLGGGPVGSFGGLVPPMNVARAPDGAILLLDRASSRLRRFDGCDCRFVTVPCTGGPGDGARELAAPGGIATCGELLLIADTGNRRVSAFSLYGYLLRGHWRPPVGALPNPWQPVAVAARRGCVAVADPANGAVHLFRGNGAWLSAVTGLGAVDAVTFDRQGRLYVASAGEDAVRILGWPGGETLAIETRPEAAADRFVPLPFGLGHDGTLDLAALCVPGDGPARFGLSGEPLPGPAKATGPRFLTTGSYTSAPLDSALYKCAWDRVALTLSVPDGCTVRVLTFAAETALTDAEIAALPASAWTATATATAATVADGQWDALIRSDPGRYLWLRIVLSGEGAATPRLAAVEIDFPRISLRRYLPAVYGEEPVSADFTDRFLAIFDRGMRQVEARIDDSADDYDPLSAPAGPGRRDFLSWLASWVGVTLDRQLPLARRRLILKSAGKLFRLRGTKNGLRQMLGLYLGIDERRCAAGGARPCCGPSCTTPVPPPWEPPQIILEHFMLRRWLFVGAGRLGDDARLWGERIVNRSQLGIEGPGPQGGAQLGVTQLKTTQDPLRDPFHIYAHRFSVFLPAWIARRPGYRRAVDRLIRAESPAHTVPDIRYVAPRFRVGVQSMIGFDSVVGCLPQGIEIEKTRLGRASVLGSADGRDTPLRVGRRARVGRTTTM